MIKELTKGDFHIKNDKIYINKAKNTGGMMIVKADWCGHCKRTIPELHKVSEMTGSMYPIFKLDSDKEKEMVDKLKVVGFPTIFFIEKDGRISDKYTEGRDMQKFLDQICDRVRVCF